MRTVLALSLLVLASGNPAFAEIRVGVAASLGGRFAPQGAALFAAVETKLGELNKAGGLLGHQLLLVPADDGCNAASGAEAARALVAAKAAVVVGHVCGSAALAAASIYAQAETLLLSQSRHPELTDRRAGPTIFRVAGRDDRQGEAIARHILTRLPGRPIALIHDRTQYGQSLAAGVLRTLAAAQVSPLVQETIVAGEKDYPSLSGRLAAAQVRVVVLGSFPAETTVVAQALRRQALDVVLIGGDALAGEALQGQLDGVRFLRMAGPEHSPHDAGSNHPSAAFARLAIELWHEAATAAQAPGGKIVAARMTSRAPSATGDAGGGRALPAILANGDADVPSYRVHIATGRSVSPAD